MKSVLKALAPPARPSVASVALLGLCLGLTSACTQRDASLAAPRQPTSTTAPTTGTSPDSLGAITVSAPTTDVPNKVPAVPATPAPSIERVGGDLSASIERTNDPRKGLVYRFQRAKIDTPLPVGYPEPTPPGAIDLKRYPSVRRAEVRGTVRPEQGRSTAFFPLFRHIESRGIAMTSPVEMDYHGESFDRPNSDELPEGQRNEPWTMSFLYREMSDGPADGPADSPSDSPQPAAKEIVNNANGPAPGTVDKRVIVRDTAPLTVLSIGVRGDYSASNRREALNKLEAWLADHPEWTPAGDPRALYYNDPFVNPMWKWSEVQLPIDRAPEATGNSGQPDQPSR